MSKSLLNILRDFCETFCGCSDKMRMVPHWEVSEQAEAPKPFETVQTHRRCEGEVILMAKLKYYEQGKIDPIFLDHKNNPVPASKIQSVTYQSDNSDGVTLSPVDGRPNATLVKPTGALGPNGDPLVVNITMTADVDPAEGIQPKIGVLQVEIDSGDVETVALQLTEIEDQPDAPPVAPPATP